MLQVSRIVCSFAQRNVQKAKIVTITFLQVDPSRRITVRQLLDNPWLNKDYKYPIKWTSIYDVSFPLLVVDASRLADLIVSTLECF